MAASERLRYQLESTEARIEVLQNTLYQVDADARNVRGRIGWLRALQVRALKVGIRRQLGELELRRAAARTCHAETMKYEEWLGSAGRREETKTAAGV